MNKNIVIDDLLNIREKKYVNTGAVSIRLSNHVLDAMNGLIKANPVIKKSQYVRQLIHVDLKERGLI